MAIGLTISQGAALSPLTATDTSTGITVTSRMLTVYDADNVLVGTYDMGVNLTQDVIITKDVYYTFILTLNGSITKEVSYLSTRQYDLQALTLEDALNCNCKSAKSLCNDATKALISKANAITYFIFGQGANAQRNIAAANTLITTKSNCSC